MGNSILLTHKIRNRSVNTAGFQGYFKIHKCVDKRQWMCTIINTDDLWVACLRVILITLCK